MDATPPTSNPRHSCLLMLGIWLGALVFVVAAATIAALVWRAL